MKRIAVVRIRGRAKVNKEIENALKTLRLTRVNHCSIVDDRDSYIGTLHKVKDYVTWGEIDEEDLINILKNRGQLCGRKKLTDDYVKKHTNFNSIEEFAKAFLNFEAELKDIPGLRPFFRLHPPRKGHGKIKRSFKEGGALGERENIKPLLYRMR